MKNRTSIVVVVVVAGSVSNLVLFFYQSFKSFYNIDQKTDNSDWIRFGQFHVNFISF